jgi:outer membrane PBP1 activator LpoA protein
MSCGGQKSSTVTTQQSLKNANYYLGLAKTSAEPNKSKYLLQAGIVLAQSSAYLKAQETFTVIEPSNLSQTERESYYLYYGYSLLNLAQSNAALRFLNRITRPEQQSIDWQVLYRESLADSYLAESNYLEAAKIRIELDGLLLDQTTLARNHEAIWQALNQLSISFLSQFSSDLNSRELNGWLELSYLTKNNASNPQKLIKNLQLWQAKYPTHSANINLPKELVKISQAKIFQPKQIALLLPLSGRLARGGRMIRDGFLASHYGQAEASDLVIKVYDTAQSLSALTPYNKAIEDGADFIVGPLSKDAVEEILNQESLTVPMLTLNNVTDESVKHENIFQFGLLPEDEVRQIAELAITNKHSKAVIIAPDDEQGSRAIETFRQTFEQLDGSVSEVQRYKKAEDIKENVRQLLNVDLSESRSKELQRILGRPVLSTPRRRQDIDMVFVVASPSDGRRIKPFLNFYYAQDIPVYSLSKINPGSLNRQLNGDLNGITFTDSPFFVSNNPTIKNIKRRLSASMKNLNTGLGRLFTLGYDAYQLLPDLNMLQSLEQFYQQGLSGDLSVTTEGRIRRRLTVAKFAKGVASEVAKKN